MFASENTRLEIPSIFIDQTEMYDSYNKRSLDLSENKKQRCLNFQNFSDTDLSFISN